MAVKKRFSEDKVIVSEKYSRSIREINFALHRAKIAYIEAVSDWVVRTDITRFYPSIYTHSLPWAAYGKERVKANMKDYRGSLADRIDLLVRACNRNQTIGIPIGPETSRIIAEIISSRIDSEFEAQFRSNNAYVADRLQDDWVIGIDTLENAEKALSAISSVYRAYGLEINGTKTSIDHIVAMQESTWLSEFAALLSNRRFSRTSSGLREFLNFSLRLQSQNPADPVINYALSILENLRLRSSDLESMESFLLKTAVAAPNSLDRISRIVLNIQYSSQGISKKRVGDRFLSLAERNLEMGHIYEAVWLLYTLRGLKKPIFSRKILELVEDLPSSIIIILLMDMQKKGI